MLTAPQTCGVRLTVAHWYGGEARAVEVCMDTAVWYHSGLPAVAIRWLLLRDPHGAFAPQALVTTQFDHAPAQMLAWFVRRWTMEVTFEEARTHLGIETQRQWNDLAIGRTTPALFGLYSLVTRLAHGLLKADASVVRTAAWYAKPRPTFADAIAAVRRELWSVCNFAMSESCTERIKILRSVFEHLTDTVCYAAWLDKVERRNPVAANVRNRLASALSSLEIFQNLVRHNMSEIGVNYRESPIVAEYHESLFDTIAAFGGRPRAGDRAPDTDGLLLPDGSTARLFDLLRGDNHKLFLFGAARSETRDAANILSTARQVLTSLSSMCEEAMVHRREMPIILNK